jgi:hypothetical protein
MLLSRAFDIKHATKNKKILKQKTMPAKPTARHCLKSLQATHMSFPVDSDMIDSIIDTVDDDNHLDNGLNIGVDVVSVALEAFTSAIINYNSAHYGTSHYINDHAIIYDHFNKMIPLLFKMELDPSRLPTGEF